ncbi:hypothetical protein predicted by Glimmer/Critica [Acetobacter ghanensis]|uniref:Uncharacterized protein n=1 Tax=Acetobacter ghanensis TaxID=431306 RepID=A0A0U5F958_9PROT|nr:hypothetical protein predicted by Glimmer/Critica [Acetobacter ghanensis]
MMSSAFTHSPPPDKLQTTQDLNLGPQLGQYRPPVNLRATAPTCPRGADLCCTGVA